MCLSASRRRSPAAALLIAGLLLATSPARAAPCALDASQPRLPSVAGEPALRSLLDGLQRRARAADPEAATPERWAFDTDASLLGSLMFERTDLIAVSKKFDAATLVPYQHQFRGDMIAAPWMVQIAWRGDQPVFIAANRRPGAPPASAVRRFLELALDDPGQQALAAAGARPLTEAERGTERAKLAGFVAPVDPSLPEELLPEDLRGPISSVGSDGMKSLMDSWMCRLHALRPAVHAGFRWEHLGTLNGWHALLAGEADVAPMGRELWPQELAAWRSAFPASPAPLEIMVARGGFDTPQRTTAQAIFVNPANRLRSIRVEQLAQIFDGRIERWEQLGLDGAWAARPIHLRIPPRVAPNTMSMQAMVLDGAVWRTDAQEASSAATAEAILRDPEAIGFGGLEEGAPGLAVLAVVPRGGDAPVELDAETASSGRYPLTRAMYLRFPPGPLSPPLALLVRLILSRDGQARVVASGYFPLTAAEAARERRKLQAYQQGERSHEP